MIRFEEVTKEYADGTKALDHLSTTVAKGKLTAVIGPSGCGKTTFLRMINRLETPTAGYVEINGKDIAQQDPVSLRRSIGYVIQRIGLLPHYTIAENIALVPSLLKWDKEKINVKIDELLELVDLPAEKYRTRYPLELSGGQQQRIGVARALASDPDIILMDEPFSALDPISREQLQVELRSLQQKIKKTIVFVTHDMDEALDIADEIIVMRAGEIEQVASPMDLLLAPKNDFVAAFIGPERVARRLGLAKRKLSDFQPFFSQVETGTVVSIDAEASLEAARSLLEDADIAALAVTQAGTIIGYVTTHTLLKIAFQGSDSHAETFGNLD